MKKILCFFLSVVMLCTLVACGAKQEAPFEWTRKGTFEDADGNYLNINPSDNEEYPGWAVTFALGEAFHGWFIQQEGKTLHGNLTAEYEDADDYIVTVAEEGEDGVALTAPDGKVYHFTPVDMPSASIFVHLNIEGIGEIAYAKAGEALEFDGEHAIQSAQINLAEPETYTLAARPKDGYEFVKWTRDGADLSTDAQITVEFSESADYVAVFKSPDAE